jgi:2-polyprenyl-3-methyl-5-hydroxy-6-metoxy-1,4-benzoquinol methylase
MSEPNYIDINRKTWNQKTEVHYESDFYNVKEFITGGNSLNSIELDLLGDLNGKKVLHLQCHFGQDSISLERLGAKVTGVDLSDKAIEKAQQDDFSEVATLLKILSNPFDEQENLEAYSEPPPLSMLKIEVSCSS